MHRTEADNKIVVGGLNKYTDGPPGTTIDAADRNTVQEELAYLIETAGLTLKSAATETNQQAYNAILALITANSPNSPKVDFESKDLIIDVASITTVDADAKRLSLLNTSSVPAYIDDLNTTFNIATDLMAGTTEKASTWYQLWIDSGGTRLMVPDLESTTDGTTASKLVDSGADFVTDKVQVGDIVYNTTDLTQTTVTAVDDLHTLSLVADIFVSGEDYKIRALSPVGLGTAFKARIGAAFNNSGSNLDDSTYTQIQEVKNYTGALTGADFDITGGAGLAISIAFGAVLQENDWTGRGYWKFKFNVATSFTSSTNADIAFTGVQFRAGGSQAISADEPGTITTTQSRTNAGTSGLTVTLASAGVFAIYWGEPVLDKKPSFHK